MKQVDILKDILEYLTTNQVTYNHHLIEIHNPEIRQLFTQLRDDEMRSIMKLQKKILRIEEQPSIITKTFPTKS